MNLDDIMTDQDEIVQIILYKEYDDIVFSSVSIEVFREEEPTIITQSLFDFGSEPKKYLANEWFVQTTMCGVRLEQERGVWHPHNKPFEGAMKKNDFPIEKLRSKLEALLRAGFSISEVVLQGYE